MSIVLIPIFSFFSFSVKVLFWISFGILYFFKRAFKLFNILFWFFIILFFCSKYIFLCSSNFVILSFILLFFVLSSKWFVSFVIYELYFLDVKSISLEIFFLIKTAIICLYKEVCESKTFLDNFCFKFSGSISKCVLHISITLSSIGYLVVKILNPFCIFKIIFFSLNKAEFIILSRLYLSSIFGSKIFLKKSCIFFEIFNGKANSTPIIFFCIS